MSERLSKPVIARFVPTMVEYFSAGMARVHGCANLRNVPGAEADKALAAMRSTPPREIEVIDGPADEARTIRLVPVVVVKARGKVCNVNAGDVPSAVVSAGGFRYVRVDGVESMREAARAIADDAEVEIVSIDGEPDMVRRVS